MAPVTFQQRAAGSNSHAQQVAVIAQARFIQSRVEAIESQLRPLPSALPAGELEQNVRKNHGESYALNELNTNLSAAGADMAQKPARIKAQIKALLEALNSAAPVNEAQRNEFIRRLRACLWRCLDKTYKWRSRAEFDAVKNYSPDNTASAAVLQAQQFSDTQELQTIFGDDTKQVWDSDEVLAKLRQYHQRSIESSDRITKLDGEIIELNAAAGRNELDMSNAHSQCRDLQEERNALQEKLDTLNQRLSTCIDRQLHIAEVNRVEAGYKRKFETQAAEFKTTLANELTALRNQLTGEHSERMAQQIETDKLHLELANKETREANEKLGKLQDQFDEQIEFQQRLQSKLTTAEGTAAAGDDLKNARIKELKKQKEASDQSVLDLRHQAAELRQKIREIDGEKTIVTELHDGLVNEVAGLKEAAEEATQAHLDEKSELETSTTAARDELKLKDAEAKAVTLEKEMLEQNTIPGLKNQIYEWQQNFEAKVAELSTSKSRHDSVQTELGKLKARCDGLDESVAQKAGQILELEEKKGSLEQDLEGVRGEKKTLTHELDSSKTAHSSLQSDFDQFKISSSAEEARTMQVLGELGSLLGTEALGVAPCFRGNVLGDLGLIADLAEGQFVVDDRQPLDWDLATVSSELIQHHSVDDNLPRHLWLHVCNCVCTDDTLALIELNIHAIRSRVQFPQPQSAQIMLIAAVRMVEETRPPGDDDPTVHALCALRALEVVLRYQQPVGVQLIQRVCDAAAAIISAVDFLGQSLLQWVRGCLAGANFTLLDALHNSACSRLDVVRDARTILTQQQLRKSLVAEPNGVLLVDYNSVMVWRYAHDQISFAHGWESEPFDVVSFHEPRRSRGDLSAMVDPFVTMTTVGVKQWLNTNLAQQRADWALRDEEEGEEEEA